MFLQIGLGILPAAALLVFFAVKRRKCVMKYAFSAFVFIAVSAASLACAGAVSKYGGETEEASVKKSVTATADSIEMAYALALDGNIADAKQVLSDYCLTGIVTPEYSLCLARVNALGGDYQAALALYQAASGNFTDEIEACKNADANAAVDTVLGKLDPTIMGDKAETEALVKQAEEAAAKVDETVKNACDKELDGKKAEKLSNAAALAAKANKLYEEYTLTGTVDKAEAKQLKKDFENVSDEALKVSYIRLGKLKALVLNESYDEIAESADEYSDHNELMILAELYVNGYIKEKDFSDKFASGDPKFDVLKQWTNEILDSGDLGSSKSPEYKAVESFQDYFDSYTGKPALAKVRDSLDNYASVKDAEDRSKAYMELAKIETSQGNQSTSDRYMTKALETAGICRDESYTKPVYSIIGIIENKDDNESLKNVSGYVNDIITNSTTVKMPEVMYYENPEQENKEDVDTDFDNDNNGDNESENETESKQPEKEQSVSFDNYVSDFVSRKRTSLNIMNINTEKFPQITAEISVDSEISYSENQLSKILSLQDCGLNIPDFTIEKVNYSSVNFLLCCDYSGSMEGQPINDLKEAVKMFLNDSDESINFSVVTFTDSVDASLPFGTTRENLINTIESDYAGGGTNMYGAVLRSIGMFGDKDALNVIVLLSDGDDNDPQSYETIKDTVGRQCAENNITVYALGLGTGANAEYLSRFSTCTNGEYLYASGSETLLSFYEFIQNMSANRYKITYTAQDTELQSKRLLEASITDDDFVTSKKYYSLNGGDEDGEDVPPEEEEEAPVNTDISVTGIDTKLIYATDDEVKIKLLGKGFEDKQMAKVTFEGVLTYSPAVKYLSETEYELTLPGSMACGVYNVTAIIGGKKFSFDDAFTVAVKDGFLTQFGKYSFTSLSKTTDNGVTKLSGNVRMNNWLCFYGTVELSGDFSSEKIHMEPSGASYISYDRKTASGLAKLYAATGTNVRVDLSCGLDLYKDGTTVDETGIEQLYMLNLLEFTKPEVSLYPDRLEVDYNSISTKFPFQDKIIKDPASKFTPFWFEVNECKSVFTGKTVGVNLEIKKSDNEKIYKPVQIGSMNFNVNNSDFELKINTYTGEYEIKFLIKLMFIDSDGMGLSIKWDDGLAPDEVKFYADFDVNTNISGVPVTFSDFMVGATDMVRDKDEEGYIENATWSTSNVRPILDWKFTGSTKISLVKIDSLIPGIKKYLGDVSVASFEDTTLTFSIGRGYVGMSTTFKVLEAVELGSASFEAGNIDYTNELLGIDDERVKGFVGKASKGIKWEADNVKVDVSTTGELSLTDKFLGISGNGTMNIELKWWVFKKEMDKSGDFCVGLFEDGSGTDFTLRARWQEKKGKTDGFVVSWKNGELDLDTKYFR